MPELERVQQNTALTLAQQWYEDGAAVDPGTVTVGITRADGTVLVAPGAGTGGATTAPRTFNLTTAHTTLLDTLTATWTSTLKGTLVSYVEVVGGFLFTIAAARALKPLDNVTTYPAAAIAQARIYAETELENECGIAFVPRYRLETITGDGGSSLMLSMPRVRAIRSISINGTALTVGELADLTVGPYLITGRTWSGHLVVGYEHGWDSPPPGATESALLLAKQHIVRGPVDDRATQRPTEFGPINLATAGMFGSRWGLPSVDAFVRANNMHVGVA